MGPSGLQCISADAIDPMKRQARIDPYSENPFFEDGRGMRRPPNETIPRQRPLPSDPLSSGISDGGAVDKLPLMLSAAVFVDGRKAFEITCAACHGLAGDGDSVVARQMQLRPPPSLHETRIRALSDGDLLRVITEGYGMMPSYRVHLTAIERWSTVAYVRALQRSQGIPLASAPPDVRDRILGAQR